MKAEVKAKKPTVFKFPKKLGECIDRLAKLEADISKVTSKYAVSLAPLAEEQKALEKHLIESIPKAELEGAMGKTHTVQLDRPSFPAVKDWAKLYAYIAKTKGWDLLHKRTSTTAFRERWDNKVVVPGVDIFRDVRVKLTPRKKK